MADLIAHASRREVLVENDAKTFKGVFVNQLVPLYYLSIL